VVLVSADLDELLTLADRIAVMYGGKILAIVTDREASRETLGPLMAGVPIPQA
jgi:simple sugar transport system ATP-binding protein